jgi:GR25 family glycosyltransferase involved in LPS biosynthesis
MIVYYINLEHRTDRRSHIEKELEGLTWPIERIDAVLNQYGILGCVFSHIKTLERFLESTHDECIILEDDFEFTRPKEELHVPQVEWDLVMLSGNVIDQGMYTKDLNHIYDAQTTSGYMITKNFAKILLENFKESAVLLEQSRHTPSHALDMYWKRLQPISKWYIFNPKFGKQCASYSDIECKDVNYQC